MSINITGAHAGDTVKVRGTNTIGVVKFFDGGLTGKYTVILLSDGSRKRVLTEDLELYKKGPGWDANACPNCVGTGRDINGKECRVCAGDGE